VQSWQYLLQKNQFAKAIELYKKALTINPEYAIVLGCIGVALQETNQLTESIDALKKAVNINPKYDTAWYNLGNAYYKSKEMDKSRRSLSASYSHKSLTCLCKTQF
jgi:superkiller protein 3